MSKTRLTLSARRRVRAVAHRFVDSLSGDVDLAEHDFSELLRAAGEWRGAEVRLQESAALPDGVLAQTKLSGSAAVIHVSAYCTTARHTVAHEIGHLVLGHSHTSPQCIADEMDNCPPGFEQFHLALLGENMRADEVETHFRAEEEAELFASELLKLWPVAGSSRLAVRVASGL